MDQNTYIIKFENASPMEASIYIEELRKSLLDAVDQISVKRMRYESQSQDFGSVLVVTIGTSVAATVAVILKNWLYLHTNASLTLETSNKKIIVKNVTSKDAVKIAELLLYNQKEINIDNNDFEEVESRSQDTYSVGDALSKSFEIFFSYSHQDEDLRIELEKYLISLKRELKIKNWHSGEVRAGENVEEEIKSHLMRADIILLLVSPDFIASDFCFNVEMKKALERHKSSEASVIPVILRPTLWENTPFGHLRVLPTNLKPVTLWSDRDEAFLDIARGIKKIIISLI